MQSKEETKKNAEAETNNDWILPWQNTLKIQRTCCGIEFILLLFDSCIYGQDPHVARRKNMVG